MIRLIPCIFGILSCLTIYSADHVQNSIPSLLIMLDRGYQTEIPSVLLEQKRTPFFGRVGETIVRHGGSTSLMEAIATQCVYMNEEMKIRRPRWVFYPRLVEVKNDNELIDHGNFISTVHVNASKCIKHGRAAFYPYRQGVIIYWDNPSQNKVIITYQQASFRLMADKYFSENKELSCDGFPIIFQSVFCDRHSKL